MTPLSQLLVGRTVVMTGATSGIGLAAAIELAARGARLALVARSPARAEHALEQIRARAPRADVEIVRADLSVMSEVARAAEEVARRCPQIDVLFNNAGVVKLRREVTADGYEATFATNHLAYFLFTSRLLDRLRATPGARIVSTASEAHRFGGALDFGDLMHERRYRGMVVYGRSKLANILWTRELTHRLEGSGVTANCFHPGAVATRLGQTDAAWTRLVGRVLGWFMRPPERGAATGVWLACSRDVAGVSGHYYADERERQPAAPARDDAAARRLWAVSEDLVAKAGA
jgi:NAD(P)-dependent dehydrogenase (short-subunit alcohol dehydrogenase family)